MAGIVAGAGREEGFTGTNFFITAILEETSAGTGDGVGSFLAVSNHGAGVYGFSVISLIFQRTKAATRTMPTAATRLMDSENIAGHWVSAAACAWAFNCWVCALDLSVTSCALFMAVTPLST